VLENKGLRRIFGLKRIEVTGGWRKLNNDNQIFYWVMRARTVEWVGHVVRVEYTRIAHTIIAVKP
jgi:hypothetical protein